jgi:FtsH-binding integral membrane protein
MTYDPTGTGSGWPRPAYGPPGTADVDIGLRQYMLRVYNFMAAGLGISGLVAYLRSQPDSTSRLQERRLSGL